MASHRRPTSASPALPAGLPPIDALFLIDFDVKKGYTIAWKRTSPGVDVDGRVEYKSLPSGLHTVSEDLIYFVHDGQHAGLSAFVNMPCEEEEARNARMISVGVLVPLSYGRLGRAWRHAEGLKRLAVKLARNRDDTALLDAYWEASRTASGSHAADDGAGSNKAAPLSPSTPAPAAPAVTFSETPTPLRLPETPKGHTRNRSASDGASLAPPEQRLSPYHPAWSLTSLLEKFGPLIFPIHRAALLRQRILISCHAPVHEICDFVYNLSVLSNIPLSLANVLPEQSSTQRLRPLFTIGVHDVPFLTEDYEASKKRQRGEPVDDDEAGSGWIACTTDSILAMKDTLWDMLITMPPDHAANAKERAWPVVECPRGRPVRATQRDLRRFNTLRAGLSSLASAAPASASAPRPETPRTPLGHAADVPPLPSPDDSFDKVTEPLSWAALAYNGYMWWASAGEQLRSEEQEQHSHDAALLADLVPSPQSPSAHRRPSSSPSAAAADPPPGSPVSGGGGDNASKDDDSHGHDDEARVELAVIAYFHRLTTQTLSILSEIVDSADEAYPRSSYRDDDENDALIDDEDDDDDDDDAAGPPPVTVDSRSIENMGLDVWSAADNDFVQRLTRVYFGREARIDGKGIEVCGVRVC